MISVFRLVFILCVFIFISSCTVTIPVIYKTGLGFVSEKPSLSAVSIAVGKFQDDRLLFDQAKPETASVLTTQEIFPMPEGIGRYSLSFEGDKSISVSSMLQAIFIKELGEAGYKATTLESSKKDGVYTLEGRIIEFEFGNPRGDHDFIARLYQPEKIERRVKLEISLVGIDGEYLFKKKIFHHKDSRRLYNPRNNADRLVNVALKNVLLKVLVEMDEVNFSAGTDAVGS